MNGSTVLDLLKAYGAAEDALVTRGVARSNIVGDYAEHLFERAFGWNLAPKSQKWFDLDAKGMTYQVKARRLSPTNRSCEMGAMPTDETIKFDALATIVFETDFSILYAAIIPVEVLKPLRTSRHTTRPRFVFRPAHLQIRGVEVVSDELRAAQSDWT